LVNIHPAKPAGADIRLVKTGDDVTGYLATLVGAMSSLAQSVVAHGLATEARTARSIDRYLAGRLPRHEQTLKPDDQ
jgi:hypothetical protein